MPTDTNELFPDATATGDFARTPFAHVLVYVWTRNISGSLEVRQGNRNHLIYFMQGKPAASSTGDTKAGLGDILVRRGTINAMELEQARKLGAREKIHEVQALMKAGLVSPQMIVEAQKEFLIQQLIPLFGVDSAPFGFFEGRDLFVSRSERHLDPVHTLRVLMEGIRVHGTPERIDPHVAGLDGKTVVFQNVENVEHFGFTKREKEFCRRLVGYAIASKELGIGTPIRNLDLRRVLYLLLITKTIRIVGPNETVSAIDRLQSIPPNPRVQERNLPPQVLQRRQEVLKMAEQMMGQNYFEMLKVDPESDAAAIKQAYFAALKKFHPQLAQDPNFSDCQAVLEYITANLTEAHSVLSDDDARQGYLLTLASRGGTSKSFDFSGAKAIVTAELAYQKAKEHFEKGEFDQALGFLDQALVEKPGDPECVALDSWIRSLKRDPAASVDDLIDRLHIAHQKAPQSFQVNFYLGRLYRRVGRMQDAQIYLQRACEIDPTNMEAAREMKILMQSPGFSHDRDSSTHSGLLDVLFGRRKK